MKKITWHKECWFWFIITALLLIFVGVIFIVKCKISPEWVAIISALLLGIGGTFRDWVIYCFKKPKLKIEFKLEPPYSHKIDFRVPTTGEFVCDSYYFRLKIKNEGNYQMEGVEVTAAELYQKNENGQYEKMKDFLPLNLVWSHVRRITMPRIYRQLYRYCDFGHIIESKYANLDRFGIGDSSNIVFRLDTVVEPNTGSHILKPGDYKIKIIVAAKNVKTQSKIYNLIIKDEWTDNEEEMLSRNISIKEVKTLC